MGKTSAILSFSQPEGQPLISLRIPAIWGRTRGWSCPCFVRPAGWLRAVLAVSWVWTKSMRFGQ